MAKNKNMWIYHLAEWLLIVGGLNWGLVGFFNYNLVDAIFGAGAVLGSVVYGIVGVSAVGLGVYKLMKL